MGTDNSRICQERSPAGCLILENDTPLLHPPFTAYFKHNREILHGYSPRQYFCRHR